MANWAKKARKRGEVRHGKEVTALVKEADLRIRRNGGSHCNCEGMVPWMERELKPGTARAITKRLKILGLLGVIGVVAYVYFQVC